MTQSYNLSQLANNLDSTGRLDAADGLVNAVPIANGGTGATSASAARTNLGVAAAAYAVPAGGIIMWSGSVASIPSGWFLCNGANGTPNLQDRFIVGAGSGYGVGASGGSPDATLPRHNHTVRDPGHFHGPAGLMDLNGGGGNLGGGTQIFGTTTTNVAITGIFLDDTGVSATNANLPPYYALCFIMKS